MNVFANKHCIVYDFNMKFSDMNNLKNTHIGKECEAK